MSLSEVDDIEREIATLILDKLEHLQITPQHAAEIAKFTLANLPSTITKDDLVRILPTLDDQFIELSGIVHRHLLEINRLKTQTLLEETRKKLAEESHQKIASHIHSYFSKKYKND